MSKTIAIKFKLKGGKINMLTFSPTTKVKDALIQYLNSIGLDADPSEQNYAFMHAARNLINSKYKINSTLEEVKIRHNSIIDVENLNDRLLG